MYSFLHARNYYSKNRRYPLIYPKRTCFPQNNHSRLSTAGHWINNCNYEVPPKNNSFLIIWWSNKKCDQPKLPTFCTEPHLNHAYKYYHYHQCYHRIRVKIFNFKISPSYQYHLQGWNRFRNLRGCKHFSYHPHHLQYCSLPHHPAWIHIQIHGLQSYNICEITRYSQIQENTSGTPESSTPFTPFPAQLWDKFAHPSSTSPCCQPFHKITACFPHLK